jgi:hypothetical protein
METHIGALFENSGLIIGGKPHLKRINKMKVSQLMDFCQQSIDMTSYENLQTVPSIFHHTASLALGGDRTPCAGYSCRLKNVKKLIQFAALYSDKVYIKNFFEDYVNQNVEKYSRDDIVEDFQNDLIVFSAMLPLIEIGKIQLVTFRNYCPHRLCLASLQQNVKKEYEKSYEDLLKRYYKEINYSIRYENGLLIEVASGPETLLPPHGIAILTLRDPTNILSKAPQIAEKAKNSGEVKLSTAQAKKIGVGEEFIGVNIDNISFELGGSHFLKTSYLSDSDFEVEFIRNLSVDPVARRRSSLMSKYLSCVVPYIDSAEAKDLIKLRDSEPEAFIRFRSALNEAIDEYKVQGTTFTERDAQAVFSDIIQPQLATLDLKLRSAKRIFRKESLRTLMGWAGAISVGIYAGIIPENFIAGTVAFAGAKVGAEFLGSTMTKSDVRETIRGDEMYFLWKVKELANKSMERQLDIKKAGHNFLL